MQHGDAQHATPVDLTPADAVDAASYLLTNDSVDRYRRAVREGVERVARRIGRTERPFSGITPDALVHEIGEVDLDRPLHDLTAALDELEEVYLRDAVYFHHPRYLAHLNCPVVIPALVAEAILSAVNSSLDTWDQSAGGTLIERHLIAWTARRLGFGDTADGVFTSGGTQSNLQALVLAREEALASAGDSGRQRRLPRLRVLASEASHFSVRTSAALLGLAPDTVRTVATDAKRRMRPDALVRELRRCRRRGDRVMAVVATAGTTDYGTIDPLPAIADVCASEQVWLHVDAAYGCGLLVSPTRRHLLDGIERASSVTVDYHKSFFQPVSSSAVIVRDGAVLRYVTYHADYLNPAHAAERNIPNQVDKSLQTTRRFDALKLWLTLRVMGPDALGRLFDQVVDLASKAWELLAHDPRFEVVAPSQLSTLVFRYVPPDGSGRKLIDDANLYAREALAASGEGMVAATTVNGEHYLKFTLLNPTTTLDDIAHVLELLAEHAGRYVRERLPAGCRVDDSGRTARRPA